jgi:hypothetical protein
MFNKELAELEWVEFERIEFGRTKDGTVHILTADHDAFQLSTEEWDRVVEAMKASSPPDVL